MNPIVQLINVILDMITMALLIWIVIGWLIEFRILNRSQPLVYRLNDALTRFFEPMLRRIRPFTPNLGSVDIAPIILWLILFFVQASVNFIYAKYIA